MLVVYICSCLLCCTTVGEASDIRLVGGRNQYEGRVEVYRHRQWQTVCDDSWGIKEAEVVCRQLGYGYAIMAIDGAAFGQGSGGQWNRVWSCSGNEGSLDSCRSGSASCTHTEDASVICSSSGELQCFPVSLLTTCIIAPQKPCSCCHAYYFSLCFPKFCSSEEWCPKDDEYRKH